MKHGQTDSGPHSFVPFKWFDAFFTAGRCRHCLLPRNAHPVRCWMTARAFDDRKRYLWDDVIQDRLNERRL